ncbi:hypothetical protein NECAME_05368 [Necator americanus]|uniref:Uncharacterized protein n=1 Tax=Necator americanus TaxID=51031 RepID=W2SJU6_NECAM|nr:hypothetical protein NECAME_05368 [Necator americanus]ETN69151.1 hypothetical protein NECAME_05368 [Necator americanus]
MYTTLFPLLVAVLVGLISSQPQALMADLVFYEYFERPRRYLNLFTKLHRIREGSKRFDPFHEFIDYA